MARLQTAFQSLPNSIREWLADERIASIIEGLNRQFNFTQANNKNRVISHCILRLCVQDLEPRDFISNLSYLLEIGLGSAKTLTKEIEEQVLKPIEAPLKGAGIDLRLLYFVNPEAVSSPTVVQTALTPDSLLESAPSNLPVNEPLAIISPAAIPAIPIKETAPPPDKPFILHKHEEPATPIQKPIGSSFTYKMPTAGRSEQSAPPVQATIETPPTAQRVVHYSNFVTKPNQGRPAQQKPASAIKVPKSRWFI